MNAEITSVEESWGIIPFEGEMQLNQYWPNVAVCLMFLPISTIGWEKKTKKQGDFER